MGGKASVFKVYGVFANHKAPKKINTRASLGCRVKNPVAVMMPISNIKSAAANGTQ